ncbi:hypothetical protein HN937_29920 [Candidatus Poribacteria bacterium]|jgi:hypothetical protein|nr:hypothetical protein [Candidatus Poribacteria bacterium]
MATSEMRGSTVVTLSTSYLGTDYEIRSAKGVEVWLDDATKAFTVRYKTGHGGDWVERTVAAGGTRYLEGAGSPGKSILLNVKAASATPAAHILPVW